MFPMRTLPASRRLSWALAFALLLGLQVISSAGYMPMVKNGRLGVMLCPDGEWTAPSTMMDGMAGHRGPKSADHHQPCPYAAAAMHLAGGAAPALVPPPSFAFVLAADIAAAPFVQGAVYRRPPSTGPPIPA